MPFPILFGTTVTTVLHYRADCDIINLVLNILKHDKIWGIICISVRTPNSGGTSSPVPHDMRPWSVAIWQAVSTDHCLRKLLSAVVFASDCFSFIIQDYSKSYGWIFVRFFEWIDHGFLKLLDLSNCVSHCEISTL